MINHNKLQLYISMIVIVTNQPGSAMPFSCLTISAPRLTGAFKPGKINLSLPRPIIWP